MPRGVRGCGRPRATFHAYMTLPVSSFPLQGVVRTMLLGKLQHATVAWLCIAPIDAFSALRKRPFSWARVVKLLPLSAGSVAGNVLASRPNS